MQDALSGSPDEIGAILTVWIGALVRNAADLLSEADLLFDAKKYARALALAHFAMEEIGKVVTLISQLVELTLGHKPDWTGAEKIWSSHDLKFELFHVIDVVSQAPTASALAGDLQLLQELELRIAGRPLREMSLYVDIEEGKAKVPSEHFTEDLARLYLGTAFHAGKLLIDSLMAIGARLDQLADHVGNPERRAEFERSRAEFMRRFTTTRLAARKKLVAEMRSPSSSES
jgi:AbiV family abortive infection protein